MSTKLDSSLFVDIADAIGLGNPAIVEKDYYVIQLLKLISTLKLEFHHIVFSGGTALAKSDIKTYRMSEDVDLKLIPNEQFLALTSRNAKKNARKSEKIYIESIITQSELFSLEQASTTLDEYRYFCFDIRYPQEHQQAPCLRPFIKLECMESDFLSKPQSRSICSIYAEVLKLKDEISDIKCASILDTQAEKLLSMLRRTASVARDNTREDDQSLIRHIYDTYHIQTSQPSDIKLLASLVLKSIHMDIERYGSQHKQMIESPIEELRYALQRILNEPIFMERYNNYVTPMVYAKEPVSWEKASHLFYQLANEVLDYIDDSSSTK